MPSDAEPRLPNASTNTELSAQVNEAASEYLSTPRTIDTDTRLSSNDETESIWRARPARRSVLASLEKTNTDASRYREPALYRGDPATSHARRDQLTGDWTIFAPKRDERPNEYEPSQGVTSVACESDSMPLIDERCPFCQGAETQTPEAVWSAKLGESASTSSHLGSTRFPGPTVHIKPGEQPNWHVRVVPNKFPAVSQACDDFSPNGKIEDLFPISDVVGGHEVFIESSNHLELMTDSDPAIVYLTLLAYRDRIRHWMEIPGIEYISVFKNCGPEAGASLRHSHSQLVATSVMPQRIRLSNARAENYRARTGCTLGCDLLRAELDEKARVIDRTDSMVAFCPFASRFAGMIRITSLSHQPQFEELSDPALDQLSSFLWRVLSWVGAAFPGKAFNYVLHTFPPGGLQRDAFQWSLDVFPRLNKTAGFEWSSDCMINSLLPEAAAARYREIARQNDPRHVLARP